MYSGTFTVEITEVQNIVTPYIEDSANYESERSSKRRLDLDKIAQPIDENNEHLLEIFGGKLPSFLAQQFGCPSTALELETMTAASTLQEIALPKKRTRRIVKKLPSLEKLEKITRPPNSFMIFAQEFRPKMSQEFPDFKNKDISVK